MYDWIEIGGKSSQDLAGLVIMRYDLPPMAAMAWERTPIPGRVAALISDYAQSEAETIAVEFAVPGESLQDAWERYAQLEVARWFSGLGLPPAARKWTVPPSRYSDVGSGNTVLRFDVCPKDYYVGRLKAIEPVEETDKWVLFKAMLELNPSCPQRALSKQAGFVPDLITPPPEQITAATETCSKALTASGFLAEVPYKGTHAAALYLAITGTWTSLQVGGGTGLSIQWPRSVTTTVYIDCEAGQIYHIQDDQRLALSGVTAGDYPTLRDSDALAIGGEGIDLTARLLVVQRG